MDLAQTRAKLFRRATSPVEILYDVSSHWPAVAVALALGTLIMFAKGTSDPPKFESGATLVLSPNEVILDPDAARRPAPPRDSETNFMAEQLSLLQSDAVLEKVAAQVGDQEIIDQESDPRSEEELGPIQKGYRWVLAKINSLTAMVEKPAEGTVEERLRQEAKKVLRKLLKVENDRRSNLVRISLQGTFRNRLDGEMDAWIQAYRARIEEISEETYQRLFNERMNYWVKEEAETSKKLDAFRAKNPGIFPDQKKWNDEKVARLKLLIEDFQRAYATQDPSRLTMGLAAPLAPREEDPLADLRRKRSDMAVELSVLRGKYAPGSYRVKAAESALTDLDRQISGAAKALPAKAAPAAPEQPPETPDQIYTRKLKAFQEELQQSIAEGAALDEKLKVLQAHEDEHRKAADTLVQYRSLRERKIEQTELRKIVDVQVQDGPATSIEPVEAAIFQKVALGSLAGMAVGVFLAFGREFFGRRIRFKKDIEDELGLKVVGVVPGS
jgi:uncharacterized protein involved in exopolysaccharide biosynthesis